MPPKPTFPVPLEVTLEITITLSGMHAYLDLRDTSISLRASCGRVSLASLRQLLDRDLARIRSAHSSVQPGVWLRRLIFRLAAANFPSSSIANHRSIYELVGVAGDEQLQMTVEAVE